jgi:hypothetical protein
MLSWKKGTKTEILALRKTHVPEDRSPEIGGCSSIAFGNQTVLTNQMLAQVKTHGFASLPHGRFAFIVCNRNIKRSSLFRINTTPTTLNNRRT